MALRTEYEALLPLDAVTTTRFRRNPKSIPTRRTGELKVKANAEVVGVAAGTSPYLLDAAAVAERVIEREAQCLGHEAQGIKEVALAAPVRADQKRQRRQLHVTRGNALVIPQGDPGHQPRVGVSFHVSRRALSIGSSNRACAPAAISITFNVTRSRKRRDSDAQHSRHLAGISSAASRPLRSIRPAVLR